MRVGLGDMSGFGGEGLEDHCHLGSRPPDS